MKPIGARSSACLGLLSNVNNFNYTQIYKKYSPYILFLIAWRVLAWCFCCTFCLACLLYRLKLPFFTISLLQGDQCRLNFVESEKIIIYARLRLRKIVLRENQYFYRKKFHFRRVSCLRQIFNAFEYARNLMHPIRFSFLGRRDSTDNLWSYSFWQYSSNIFYSSHSIF